MTLEVNIFHLGKQPHDNDVCLQSYLIDALVSEEVQTHYSPLFQISERSKLDELKSNPDITKQA